MYEPFVDQCMARPMYLHLERAYEAYRGNTAPCQRGARNQCAVRMSIALGRAGFGLEGFTPPHRLHGGDGRCDTDGMPHVMGARELAVWLRRVLGTPLVESAPAEHGSHHAAGATTAYSLVEGKKGILYFNNCFQREGSGEWQGDHIDLFNGQQYYNQIIRPRAGGNESSIGNLFRTADEIWFWRLT